MTEQQRGKLKIFMGYAAGVGKTYKMLEEAQDLKAAGVDIVIGYFEPHGRKETIAKTEGLEIDPRQKIQYRDSLFEEMDTEAILARHPQVCVVDEFPHTNVPGSERGKRWEDVEMLLAAGIDVLTTMNIQHLESLNDQIWQISGIRVRETVPDWVVQQANEVVMVDLTPRALLNRLQRGVVYEREKAERALQNFFREQTLVALRELALRQAAHEVEHRMVDGETRPPSVTASRPSAQAPQDSGLGDGRSQDSDGHPACETRERLPGCGMLRRGGSGYWRSEWLAAAERKAVEQHLNFARNLHIETRILEGDDVAPLWSISGAAIRSHRSFSRALAEDICCQYCPATPRRESSVSPRTC